jgi:ATP-dependent RNA helicase DeaD
MARIYIGLGKQAGVRPQDLVGAIANEAGIAGGLIGAIQITERFSLVEVPEEVADQVIKALGKSNIRGKKVQVRRDSSDSPRRGARSIPVR